MHEKISETIMREGEVMYILNEIGCGAEVIVKLSPQIGNNVLVYDNSDIVITAPDHITGGLITTNGNF